MTGRQRWESMHCLDHIEVKVKLVKWHHVSVNGKIPEPRVCEEKIYLDQNQF